MSSGQAQDFARIILPDPPAAYDEAYMRQLVSAAQRLIASRLGKFEQPLYWGTAMRSVTGTNAALAVGAAAYTKIPFNTSVYDQDPLTDFDTANNEIEALAPGLYTFLPQIRGDGTTGTCLIAIFKNGTVAVAVTVQVRAGADLVAPLSIVLATGDAIDVRVNPTNAFNADVTLSFLTVTRQTPDPRIVR